MVDAELTSHQAVPLCPVFGRCGGCQHQDISYDEELRRKEASLRELFQSQLKIPGSVFDPIIASPLEYHYRHRLDLKLLRTRDGRAFVGFSPPGRNRLVEIDDCSIAMPAVAAYLPQLKTEAMARLTPKYREANLVVRTGDDGRVFWGGVGRRSLQMRDEDFLWTTVEGKKIFYSLDTFFQANLAILPALIQRIKALGVLDPCKTFYDLYGGVGLFGICFYDVAARVVLIEENVHAARVVKHNIQFNRCERFELMLGRVEDHLLPALQKEVNPALAMIDPPRQGLSLPVAETLARAEKLANLLYLSCHPESLVRDLAVLQQGGWRIGKVIPFDFFPKTKHLETLVLLKRN